MKDKIFVVSGPSGVGKKTIIDLAKPKLKNFVDLCTLTTRAKRPEEKNGLDYYFVSKNDFEKIIKNGEVIEYNFYNGHYYGTPKKDLEKAFSRHQKVILEIDINGAFRIKKKYPQNTKLIFIWADLADIKRRLIRRGQNTSIQIKERLKRAKKELKLRKKYDYQIKNREGKQEKAAQALIKICNQLKT